MSEKLSSEENQNIESEESERESLIEQFKWELDYLQSKKIVKWKTAHPDEYHADKIRLTESIKILKQEGIDAFKRFQKEFNQLVRQNPESSVGTIHLSEYARKNKITNTEFLREHLYARAQGEAVREEIKKENKEKSEKLKDEELMRGELNSDINN